MPVALPADLAYGKVTGTVILAVKDTDADVDTLPDSAPGIGTVVFTPSVIPIISQSGDTVVLLQKMVAPLDASGHFEIDLVATSLPGLIPSSFSYSMSITTTNGGALPPRTVLVPPNATVDIASLYRP